MNYSTNIVGTEIGVEGFPCCDYDKLADEITRWLEEYQQIRPLIEQLCNRCPQDSSSHKI